MSRESDIIKLCESVLDTNLSYYSTESYCTVVYCPLCEVEEICNQEDSSSLTMSDLLHSPSCGYLIAKDLMTGINSEPKEATND